MNRKHKQNKTNLIDKQPEKLSSVTKQRNYNAYKDQTRRNFRHSAASDHKNCTFYVKTTSEFGP